MDPRYLITRWAQSLSPEDKEKYLPQIKMGSNILISENMALNYLEKESKRLPKIDFQSDPKIRVLRERFMRECGFDTIFTFFPKLAARFHPLVSKRVEGQAFVAWENLTKIGKRESEDAEASKKNFSNFLGRASALRLV